MDRRGAVPAGRREGRPLRELLHQGLRAGWRPRASGSATPSTSARAPSPTARSGSSSSTAPPTGPRATKVTVPAAELVGAGGLLDPRRRRRDRPRRGAEGSVDTDGAQRPSWSLTFAGDGRALQVPAGRLALRGAAAEDQVRRPVPDALFDGRLEIDGETIELTGWPGMIGHNWGTEHAERWVWLEGTGFADSPDTYFDAGAARIKLGSRTSPWIPSGMLMLDGEPHRLGGLGAIRSASIEESPDRLLLRPPRQGHRRPRPRLGARARTSSAGSTPTPRAPSTTPSTARSPTSS